MSQMVFRDSSTFATASGEIGSLDLISPGDCMDALLRILVL
jgi:hypothetical protein